jgi:hypothetical protein
MKRQIGKLDLTTPGTLTVAPAAVGNPEFETNRCGAARSFAGRANPSQPIPLLSPRPCFDMIDAMRS